MTEDATGQGQLTEQVGRTVKRLREAKRMPYTELSERLTALGRPIPVLGLRRIERGERRVDVDDLAALARAFRIPPLLLLYPIDRDPDVWDAAKWFTGEAPYSPDPADVQAWEQGATPIVMMRRHDRVQDAWRLHDHSLRANRDAAATAETDQDRTEYETRVRDHARRMRQIEDDWQELRRTMRRFGLTPPALPDDLALLVDGTQPPSILVRDIADPGGWFPIPMPPSPEAPDSP